MFQPDGSLEEIDPEIFGIIKQEKARQVCFDGCGLPVCTACCASDVFVLCGDVEINRISWLGTGARTGADCVGELHLQSGAVSRLRFACAVFGSRGHCAEGFGLRLCSC